MTEPSHLPPAIRSYRDLFVWQRSMDLVVGAYQLASRLPRDELYGLVSQIRRAAASIPANIAEGHGRRLTGEYLQALGVANGSLKELETHVLIARRLDLVTEGDAQEVLMMADEAGRMLAGLMRRLRDRRPRPRRPWPPPPNP